MTYPVSLTIPQFANQPDAALDLARRARTLGLRGLTVFDHLVPVGDARRPVLEGAATLGAIAATTDRRVGSLVTRVSLRDPMITAGMAASLSALAPGRSVIGLGVGDRLSDEEALRYGMIRPGLADRLDLLAQTIERVRESAPGLEIWVGGRHPKVRRVAASRGDGWNAWGATFEELVSESEEVRSAATAPITVSWGGGLLLASDRVSLANEIAERGGESAVAMGGLLPGTAAEMVERLAPLTEIADELVVSILPNRQANWELFAEKVLPFL